MSGKACSAAVRAVKSPYDYLSAYRSALMGLAILWVVWFHSSVKIDFLPAGNGVFAFLKDAGFGGVDIFLLLSGMGIYCSLERRSVSRYIGNRVLRIVPVWWTYLLLYVILGSLLLGLSFSLTEIVGFASFTGFWLNLSHQGNWYVYAVMLLYLISPVLCALIRNARNRWLMCVLLILLSLIASVSCFGHYQLVVFSRVPVYLIGMTVASCLRNVPLRRRHLIGLLIAFVLGVALLYVCYRCFTDVFLRSWGLWWYPFILIAPSLSLLLAKGMDLSRRLLRPLFSALSVLGKSSLEILLVSDFLLPNFKKLHIHVVNFRISAIVVTVLSIVVGVAFRYGMDFLMKRTRAALRKKQPDGR